MNGLRALIVSPFKIEMTGASVKANPMKPSKLLAQGKPRFVYNEVEPSGRKAPKVFHPRDAAERPAAAHFSYEFVK
jgi:hypothetical protein